MAPTILIVGYDIFEALSLMKNPLPIKKEIGFIIFDLLGFFTQKYVFLIYYHTRPETLTTEIKVTTVETNSPSSCLVGQKMGALIQKIG